MVLPMSIIEALVRKSDLGEIRLREVEETALADGQVRVLIESFALTANNVTYAAFGDAMDYWRFFPAGRGPLRLECAHRHRASRSIPSVVVLGQVNSALREPHRVEHGLPTAAGGRFVASADHSPPWTTLHRSARMAVNCRELAL